MFQNLLNIRKNNFYLLLILMGLSVLPILIIGGSSISYFNRYVKNQLKETYNAGLVQLETDLEQNINDISRTASILVMATAHLELDNISSDKISEYETIEMVYAVWDLMDILKQTSRFIHSIYYLNGDKDFLLSSDRRALSFESFHDQSWADSLSGDRGYSELSPRVLSGEAGVRVLTLIAYTGRFITGSDGYFAVNINLDGVSGWIEALNQNYNAEFLVFNERADYIAGTSSHQPVSDESLSDSLRFQSHSDRGWRYVLHVPDKIFNSFLNRTVLLMVLMTGTLLILVTVFSIYVSNRLYSPIENVIRIIERSEAVVPDSSKEISFIGDLFVQMISEQSGLRKALEQNSQAIKESLLRRLFLGDPVDWNILQEQLNGPASPPSSCSFCSAVVQLLPGGANISVFDSGPAQAMAVRAYESENSENIRIMAAPLDLERITLLITAENADQIRDVLLRVRTFLDSSLSMKPLVAVGGLYDSIEDVVDSFRDALDILDSTIPDLNKHIIFHHEGLLPGEMQSASVHYSVTLEVPSDRDPREEHYRMMIQKYIEENYHKDISLELIADWMGISYSYLRKIFKTLFNSNFLDYIHTIRIEKARELLRESNQNIGEIAHSVGYMNTARLNRNFKKIIGCMPSEYRVRVRKSPDT